MERPSENKPHHRWPKPKIREQDISGSMSLYCAVPENIHTHPMEGVSKAKMLKESMKQNWKFQGNVLRKFVAVKLCMRNWLRLQ